MICIFRNDVRRAPQMFKSRKFVKTTKSRRTRIKYIHFLWIEQKHSRLYVSIGIIGDGFWGSSSSRFCTSKRRRKIRMRNAHTHTQCMRVCAWINFEPNFFFCFKLNSVDERKTLKRTRRMVDAISFSLDVDKSTSSSMRRTSTFARFAATNVKHLIFVFTPILWQRPQTPIFHVRALTHHRVCFRNNFSYFLWLFLIYSVMNSMAGQKFIILKTGTTL